MSFLHPEVETQSDNPLDLIEQIAIANDWTHQRQGDDELVVELPGQWCAYRLWFTWHQDMAVLHLASALDVKVPPAKRIGLYHLLALANEKLWVGHFDLWSEEGVPVFRHSVLVREGAPLSLDLVEDLVEIAHGECERFYPAFQFHIWGGKAPGDALAAALLETEGEA